MTATYLLGPGAQPFALLPAPKTPALRLVTGAEPAYAYGLGEWVFVPMMLSYLGDVTKVVRREPRQIVRRWSRGGENWYQVHGHPWTFHEDELLQYERVFDFTQFHRMTVAA